MKLSADAGRCFRHTPFFRAAAAFDAGNRRRSQDAQDRSLRVAAIWSSLEQAVGFWLPVVLFGSLSLSLFLARLHVLVPSFAVPFIMHMVGPNRVAVLDAGGLPQPSPFVPVMPFIYEYMYGFGPGDTDAQRTPLTNAAVSETTFNLPFIVAEVLINP